MPRFMLLIRIDESEEIEVPSEGLYSRMDALIKEIADAGQWIDGAGLRRTKEGVRVTNKGERIRTYDGPFTEAKEVVGGYSMIHAADLAEAVAWANRFVEVHENEFSVTCEVRQIDEE